uniref:Uncharacterized protein n=1 Tax=Romanomermis culicivorax TaxID=13658 RepID=A0A915I5V1_ROMCU
MSNAQSSDLILKLLGSSTAVCKSIDNNRRILSSVADDQMTLRNPQAFFTSNNKPLSSSLSSSEFTSNYRHKMSKFKNYKCSLFALCIHFRLSQKILSKPQAKKCSVPGAEFSSERREFSQLPSVVTLQLVSMGLSKENLFVIKEFLEQQLRIAGLVVKEINFRWLGVFEQNPKIPSHQKKINVKIDLASMQAVNIGKTKHLTEFSKDRRPATIITDDLTSQQRAKCQLSHKEQSVSKETKKTIEQKSNINGEVKRKA